MVEIGGILTGRIIQCIIAVHSALGPGYSEKIYRRALVIELRKRGLAVDVEVEVIVYYDNQVVGSHRIDLIVNKKVIVELKAVEALSKAHYAQARSYLKATGLQTALLVNFSTERADYRHISTHPPISRKKREGDDGG